MAWSQIIPVWKQYNLIAIGFSEKRVLCTLQKQYVSYANRTVQNSPTLTISIAVQKERTIGASSPQPRFGYKPRLFGCDFKEVGGSTWKDFVMDATGKGRGQGRGQGQNKALSHLKEIAKQTPRSPKAFLQETALLSSCPGTAFSSSIAICSFNSFLTWK